MTDNEHSRLGWIDLLWLIFLAGLAVLPPLAETHKQMILAGIGLFQIFESRILRSVSPSRRNFVSILVKVLLATLLVWHTGGINSNYYPIYYLPVVSAAMLYDGWGTMFWTLASCAAFSAFLIPALRYFRLTEGGIAELALRYLFFFLVAVVVNRFVSENRRQAFRYRELAEELIETNRRLQQAQADARRSERLAALGQLSAGLAHEIRNPLGVIRGSAEMLNERLHASDALTAELATYISSEVERLNSLVGRFLDFARPLKLKLERQDIAPIIDRTLQWVKDRHSTAKVEIDRQYSNGLPLLFLDGELAERVFTNLFDNAFEAMPEGGTLRITTGRAQSNGHEGVEIAIEDTGPGVPDEQREQIFNPFFTTKKTGVGLGLSIVSKIVDDHHGWIELDGSRNGGACFRLFFPA
ncbi:MAG TPA: ATP-binding protein [Terriglobia bacterium]|nr:ATP-binding protein [Terriglobia bacterium]